MLVRLLTGCTTSVQMWDSVTRETDQGIAIRELRRLDPAFTLEEWTEVRAVKYAALPDAFVC